MKRKLRDHTIYRIPLCDVLIDPAWSSRKRLGNRELQDSIREVGQHNPCIVMRTPGEIRPYFLVAGFMRATALTRLRVPVLVARVYTLTEAEARLANITGEVSDYESS